MRSISAARWLFADQLGPQFLDAPDQQVVLVESRAVLRRRAREAGLRIRTARLDDTVVVVRTDARLWSEDAATMRRKLRPAD